MIPALKAAIAHYGGDAPSTTVRPPLVELTHDQERSLIRELDDVGFTMPGLPAGAGQRATMDSPAAVSGAR
jgi:4-hydroxy-tetrahydrodipicolinate synthase